MDFIKCGQYIYSRRKSLGLTQAALGAKIGVTDKAISNWERGKRFPDVELLEPLAAALETDIQSILQGEEVECVKPENIISLAEYEKKLIRKRWCMNLCFAVFLTAAICLVPEYFMCLEKSTILNIQGTWLRVMLSFLAGFFANRVIREPEVLSLIAYILSMLWVVSELAVGLVIQYEISPNPLPFSGRMCGILFFVLMGLFCSIIIRKCVHAFDAAASTDF